MNDLLLALGRSLRSLAQPGVLWHLIWPTLAALVVWAGVAVAAWTPLVEALMGGLGGLPWVGAWLMEPGTAAAVVAVLVKIFLALAFLPLVYGTAALLVAAVALPLILERVGRRDYADLELRRGGSNLGSALNALGAGAVFLLAFLATLPLWLIPGAGLVLTVLLTAVLNRRAFGYDALMLHADGHELARLPAALKGPLLGVGLVGALLAFIPFVNLFAPAFTGLAFAHYLLEALRRDRAARGWVVVPQDRP